jgi:hypothetical protein
VRLLLIIGKPVIEAQLVVDILKSSNATRLRFAVMLLYGVVYRLVCLNCLAGERTLYIT